MSHQTRINELSFRDNLASTILWLILLQLLLAAVSFAASSSTLTEADRQFLYKSENSKLKVGRKGFSRVSKLYEHASRVNDREAISIASYILGMNTYRRAEFNSCFSLLSRANPNFLKTSRSQRNSLVVMMYCLLMSQNKNIEASTITQHLNQYQEQYPNFFKKYKGLAFYNIGNALLRKNQLDLGINYLREAENLIEDELTKEKAGLFSLLCVAFSDMGDFENSLTYALKSLNLSKLQDDKAQELLSYVNLAGIYSRFKRPAKSIEMYEKARLIAEDLKDTRKLVYIKLQLAGSYQLIGESDKSENLFLQTLEIAKAREFNQLKFLAFSELGNFYLNQGKFDLAVTQFEQALDTPKPSGGDLRLDEALLLNRLATAYLKLQKYQKALHSTKIAEKNSQASGITVSLVDTMLLRSQAYEGLKDSPNALKYYKEHMGLYKSHTKSQHSEKLAELETKFEVKNKQQQIDDLRREKKIESLAKSRSRIFAFSAILISLILAAFSIYIVRRMHERESLIAIVQSKNKELKAAYQLMEQLALTDPLTKLKNRRAINEELDKAIKIASRSKQPLSLILSDIDHFKAFNDNYGHDCGDFVLKSIAEKLQMLIRKQDSIGRWGGEEFIVILPNTDAQGAVNLAETLKDNLESSKFKYQVDNFDQDLSITMTFGVSEFNPEIDNLSSLISQADKMLYAGKSKGRNRVVSSLE